MARWVALILVLAVVGCRHPGTKTEARPAVAEPVHPPAAPPATSAPATSAAEPEAPPAPAAVEKFLVPGDSAASIVRAVDGKKQPAAVFLGGVCSNAGWYLWSFREAARKAGGVVGIEGDQPCGPGVSNDFHTFSWDASKVHARIEAALAAAGVSEIPKEGITLLGYSQGASLAEQLAARFPGRYSRIVLIASPRDPAPASFAKTRGLVTMACDRDVTARMRQAAAGTTKLRTPATYFEMPGCTHGQVADGERVFGEAFDWLATNEKELDPAAKPVRIVGTAL